MKTIYQLICAVCIICGFTACQDRDLPGSGEMQLLTPDASSITGTLTGAPGHRATRMPPCRLPSIKMVHSSKR